MVQKMRCRKSLRAFKWCYKICIYWGYVDGTTKEEVEDAKGQNKNITLETSTPNVGFNTKQESLLIVFNLISLLTWVLTLVES